MSDRRSPLVSGASMTSGTPQCGGSVADQVLDAGGAGGGACDPGGHAAHGEHAGELGDRAEITLSHTG
jgi:hypothetical protein